MKLEDVRKGYGKTAGKYDRLLDIWFGKILRIEKYRKEAVEWLGLREGDTVLDIGCGTGANFSLLEEKVGPDGKIIGLDYTGPMLKEAEKKIERNHWCNITLIQGDAVRSVEYVKETVDAVISTYCFSILYDIEKALLTVLEVLKPKGRIVLLDIKKITPKIRLAEILHLSNLIGILLHPFYEIMYRKYGIVSKEDLNKENAIKKLELWQKITADNLTNLRQKEFLLGMFLIFSGEKK